MSLRLVQILFPSILESEYFSPHPSVWISAVAFETNGNNNAVNNNLIKIWYMKDSEWLVYLVDNRDREIQ